MTNSILKTAAIAATALTFTLGTATASFAGEYGSAKTYSETSNTIIDAAVGSNDLTTLVAAVKAAGLVDTLNGDGPFTVFAPTNDAFAALPAGTVETLLQPENKATLTEVLTSHVVAGNFSGADIMALVAANGGKAYVTTLSGEKIKVKQWGDALYIKDANGNKSKVAIADIRASNGTVHVISGVILPESDDSQS